MPQDFVEDILIHAMETYEDVRREQLLKEGISEDEASIKASKEIEDKDISSSVMEIIESISDECITNIENIMNSNLKIENEKENNFLNHNYQLWGAGFDMSMTLYLIVLEAAEDCNKYYKELTGQEREEIHYRYNVLYNIHGRACQQFLEILWLIRGGFADGAFARCRSLYELSVVAELISKNDESIAKAYYKETDDERSNYNWANNLPNIKKSKKGYITFKNLQDLCTAVVTDKWENVYNITSQVIHASPQGTFARIGARNQNLEINVGHSDYGLDAPAINSAILLMLITTFTFNVIPNFDSKMYVRVIQKWVDKLEICYSDINRKAFSVEVPIDF